MPLFMIVLIPYTLYQFIKPFLDNEMSIFEEYGAFNACTGSVHDLDLKAVGIGGVIAE